MRKIASFVVATVVMVGFFASLATGRSSGQGPQSREKVEFGLIGDMPYRTADEAKLDTLIGEINDEKIRFTIHVGDIKSGSSRCDDALYQREYARMEALEDALVYTPGDNEWTDCHRAAAGGFNPIERLAYLRSVFFSDPSNSLGDRELALEFQSAEYPENARWIRADVTFATLHVVGSNNNRVASTNPVGNDAEYEARNQANIRWLRETFEQATDDEAIGVVLAVQANMFEDNVHNPSGFDQFLEALRTEVLAFGRPVVLVHGDSHYFRIDKPLMDPAGSRIVLFTRVEVFGDRDVHWVRGTIDPHDEEVFSFAAEIVEDNT